MAEENANEKGTGQSVNEALAGMEGLISPEKISEIRKKAKGEDVTIQKTDPGTAKTAAELEAEKKAAEAAAAKPTGGKTAPAVTVETPFGKSTYGEPGEGDIKLSSFADVQAFAKDHYDLDIKDVNDFQDLFKDLKDKAAKAAEAEQYKTAATNFENTFKSLPEEIGLLVSAYVNGTDYKPLLNELAAASKFSYDREFKTYPELEMVNHYSGKNLTKEEYDALEQSNREALREVAEAKYNAARTNYIATQKETARATENQRQATMNSVESSIAKLRSTYPDMGEAQINEVRQVMISGLRDTLYTPEGLYKDDAALKIAMQQFGQNALAAQTQTIGQLVEKLRGEGESKATEDLLRRSDKPDGERGRTAEERDNAIAAEVKRQTSFLRGH